MIQLNFRYRPCQLEVLKSHCFPGELDRDCLTRMARHIQQKRRNGEALAWMPLPTEEKRLKNITMACHADLAELLDTIVGDSLQDQVDGCLELIAGEIPIPAIATSDEAWQLLAPHQGTRILVEQAIAILRDRCADSTARELLFELHQSGTVRLVQSPQGGYRIRDRQYYWCVIPNPN